MIVNLKLETLGATISLALIHSFAHGGCCGPLITLDSNRVGCSQMFLFFFRVLPTYL